MASPSVRKTGAIHHLLALAALLESKASPAQACKPGRSATFSDAVLSHGRLCRRRRPRALHVCAGHEFALSCAERSSRSFCSSRRRDCHVRWMATNAPRRPSPRSAPLEATMSGLAWGLERMACFFAVKRRMLKEPVPGRAGRG